MADEISMGEKALVGLQWDAGLDSLRAELKKAQQLIDANKVELKVDIPKKFRQELNKELKEIAAQLRMAMDVAGDAGDPKWVASIGNTAKRLHELTSGFYGLGDAKKRFEALSVSASKLGDKLQKAVNEQRQLDAATSRITKGTGKDITIEIDTSKLDEASTAIASSIEKITASVRELVGELKTSQGILNKAAEANAKIKEKGLGVDVSNQEDATKRYKAQAEMLEARAKVKAAEAKERENNVKLLKAMRAEDAAMAQIDAPDKDYVKEAKKTLSDSAIKSLGKDLEANIDRNLKYGSDAIRKELGDVSQRYSELQKQILDIDWSDETSINAALTNYKHLAAQIIDLTQQLQVLKNNQFATSQEAAANALSDVQAKLASAQGLSGSKIPEYGNQLNAISTKVNDIASNFSKLDDASVESIQRTIKELKNLETQIDKLQANKNYNLDSNKGIFTELSGGLFVPQAESIAKTYGRIISGTVRSSEVGKTWIGVVKQQNGQLLRLKTNLDSSGTGLRTLSTQISGSASLFTNLGITLKDIAANFARYFSGYEIFQRMMQGARKGWTEIKELDVAYTELRKVSNETTAELMEFRQESYAVADEVASTGKAIQQSAADWERLGYAIDEASKFAQNTALYANVGDMNIDTATEHMISSVKAFGKEFESEVAASVAVADIFNELDNNFAITAEGIGSAVERAGASLSAAGNDIYESAALITGGNEIVQDAEQVGTALRVVSLRIRGAKAELESMGESTDDLVDSTSKLRDKIQALTGVDIMLDDDTFKSTYQILDEISEVWGELTDVSAAATLELLGGKMRSNIVASMLENFDTSRAALDAARNSAGSAAKENAAYAESIEGHLNKLSNTWQEIWQNTATRDQVNFFIDMATGASKLVDQIGLINVGLGAMGGLLSAQSGVGRGKMFPLMNMPTATGGDTERVKASGFYKGTLRKQPKLILNVWQVSDLAREPIFGIRNEAV